MRKDLFESQVSVSVENREPLGIVISDGGTGERGSLLSAFVWGPVPDERDEEGDLTPFVSAAIAGVS